MVYSGYRWIIGYTFQEATSNKPFYVPSNNNIIVCFSLIASIEATISSLLLLAASANANTENEEEKGKR